MFTATARGYHRWLSIRQEQGSGFAWQWLVDRVGSRIINLGMSDVVWLSLDDIKLPGAPPEGYVFRWLTPEDIASFISVENELDSRHVERARAGHDLCFAALHGERLAAYGWYALGSIEAEHCDNVALSFPPNVSYMYKGFTHPDYRGQRLHAFGMKLALEALAAERGVKDLVSTIGWLNQASLKSCERLGYQRLGRMVRIGWTGFGGSVHPVAATARGVRFGRKADLSGRKA